MGTVRGLAVGLPTHFHVEDQITFVLSGRRRFIIREEEVTILAGDGVIIPAGTPHRSLGDLSEVVCVNLYAPPGNQNEYDLILGAALRWLPGFRADRSRLRIAQPHRPRDARGSQLDSGIREIGQAARIAGMSREGFSRRFRKLHGVPPQQFRLMEKLNEARRLLRAGESIAEVAAETGFSDQSHLGRCFRRAFGATPGRFRAGQIGSHPFQTRFV